jgi:flagellar capping protein FliD
MRWKIYPEPERCHHRNQTLTITKDTSKAETAIKAWVDAYNTLQDSFATTKYTAVDAGTMQDASNGALVARCVRFRLS